MKVFTFNSARSLLVGVACTQLGEDKKIVHLGNSPRGGISYIPTLRGDVEDDDGVKYTPPEIVDGRILEAEPVQVSSFRGEREYLLWVLANSRFEGKPGQFSVSKGHVILVLYADPDDIRDARGFIPVDVVNGRVDFLRGGSEGVLMVLKVGTVLTYEGYTLSCVRGTATTEGAIMKVYKKTNPRRFENAQERRQPRYVSA